jgi:hypothetical protein
LSAAAQVIEQLAFLGVCRFRPTRRFSCD